MNLHPRSATLHSLRASLALAFVVILAGLSSLTPAGAETIAWNVAPADESGPDGRVSLRHEVEPGESVHDAIAVTNTGDVAATFTISAGDGVVGADGAFDIDDQSHDGAGGWLTVSGTDDGTLTLEPDQSVVLPVTIDIPETALRVGTDALDLPGIQVVEISQVTVSWTGLALVVVIGAVIAGLIIRRRARR